MQLILHLKSSRYMQYVSALTATLSVASLSTYIVWASPSIPKLISDDSPLGNPLTNEEASWVASIIFIGIIVGGVMAGWIAQILGRRKALLLSAVPLFVPWIVTVFAKSAMVLILVRFVAGIGAGIVMTVVPMYIGEIAEKDIRGKLGTAFNILNISGSLFVLCVGPFVSYTVLTLSCSVFPVVFAVVFYFMPESPYYLIQIGDKELARKNLERLSQNDIDDKLLDVRLNEITQTVEDDMKNKSTLAELLTKGEHRKALIIAIGVRTLQQLSGVNAIDSYMLTIIEASSSSIPLEASSIIFGAIQLPAVLVAALLVDRMGRKPLLIISAFGCAVALIGEGVYFFLQEANVDVGGISWLPTAGLTLYVVMINIGVMTLPYVLLSEIFLTNVKSVATSLSTYYAGILGFLAIKFFTPVSDAWGMYTILWLFAGVCILGCAFVFFVLPETKGKTFSQIQEKLNKNRRIRNTALSI